MTHKQGGEDKLTKLDWSGEIVTHPKDVKLRPNENFTLLYF